MTPMSDRHDTVMAVVYCSQERLGGQSAHRCGPHATDHRSAGALTVPRSKVRSLPVVAMT